MTRKRIIPGEYKTLPNHVLTTTGEVFQFAAPEETPAKMAELTAWLQQWLQTPPAEQHSSLLPTLTKLHHRFIRIHPFDDGNGRVVRLLLAYVLIRLGYLPMLLHEREEYIRAIQFADVGDFGQLQALFENRIVAMLQKGIAAKTAQVALSDNVV